MLRLYRSVADVTTPVLVQMPVHLVDATVALTVLLVYRSDIDPSLSLRFSCREGICGSCAVLINGRPGLACLHWLQRHDLLAVSPLSHFAVVRDLVVDLTVLYGQYALVRPWLAYDAATVGSVAHRVLLEGHYECILCCTCVSGCPSYW